MSLRRTFRQNGGAAAVPATAPQEPIVGDVADAFGTRAVGDLQDTSRDKSNCSPTNADLATNHISSYGGFNSSTRPKRIFVGDRVEFCPIMHADMETESVDSAAIGDANDATANLAPVQVQTTNVASADSTMSSTISSSDDSEQPKGKAHSPLHSSSSSPAFETKGEEPQKKKGRPMRKRKLRITMNTVRRDDSESKPASEPLRDCNYKVKTIDNNKHGSIQKARKHDNVQTTIQQLLSLRNKRSLQAQSNLSLSQLKQQARQKARANKSVPPPKRKKRSKNSRKKKSKSSASSNESEILEHVDKIEMNTGTLLLFRGENPRAKFVRRK